MACAKGRRRAPKERPGHSKKPKDIPVDSQIRHLEGRRLEFVTWRGGDLKTLGISYYPGLFVDDGAGCRTVSKTVMFFFVPFRALHCQLGRQETASSSMRKFAHWILCLTSQPGTHKLGYGPQK